MTAVLLSVTGQLPAKGILIFKTFPVTVTVTGLPTVPPGR